ncbi:prepilin-type N-terminal cleavage/methylation domain-containing protein [uncultured Desulfuromusa sp.]|uniref:prepilin-type N-terminal cleavage/methylation domain-containing protein n=1 Tax=uncultured Desulfuromusa sp. TaxID=219183 RepID=UPI002AA7A635|nr:prepilin-type N-terminal cleavage/methylation domain-containing protein [uncultured Desulfuromusa sp.]
MMLSDDGFTLLEILIVVVIIGILAAISVPIYATFRIRSFEAAALSDLDTVRKAQFSLSVDARQFGQSTNVGAAVVLLGNGVVLQGPGAINDGLANLSSFVQISASNGVGFVTNTDPIGSSFTVTTKHVLGAKIFAYDNDIDNVRYVDNATNVTLAVSGVSPASVRVADNIPFAGGWRIY